MTVQVNQAQVKWEREPVKEEDYLTKERRIRGWYNRLVCQKCGKALVEYFMTSDWAADQLLYTQSCPHFNVSEWTEASVEFLRDYKDDDDEAKRWFEDYQKEKELAIEKVRVDGKYIFILPREGRG